MQIFTLINFTYPITIAGEVIAEIEGRADVEINTDDAVYIETVFTPIEFYAGPEYLPGGNFKRGYGGKIECRYVQADEQNPADVAFQDAIVKWIKGPGHKQIMDRFDVHHAEAEQRIADSEAEHDLRNER